MGGRIIQRVGENGVEGRKMGKFGVSGDFWEVDVKVKSCFGAFGDIGRVCI